VILVKFLGKRMDKPNYYEIRVKGHLDDSWSDWFEGLAISNEASGEGEISGWLPDQAALQGVLNQIGNLGLVLISVNIVQSDNEISAADRDL
jgi:hypothetical protein